MPCGGCGDNCKCTASQCCQNCKCDSSCNCAAKKSTCSGDSCAAPKK
nr:metallothionein 2 [Ostrinia furnacalis]